MKLMTADTKLQFEKIWNLGNALDAMTRACQGPSVPELMDAKMKLARMLMAECQSFPAPDPHQSSPAARSSAKPARPSARPNGG